MQPKDLKLNKVHKEMGYLCSYLEESGYTTLRITLIQGISFLASAPYVFDRIKWHF